MLTAAELARSTVVFHRDIRRWSPEDDATLRDLYPVGGWRACQKVFPNRSKTSIRGRAKRLGLWRTTGPRSDWSGEELAALRKHYANSPMNMLRAALPNRSIVAIRSQALKHGFVRSESVRHPKNMTGKLMLDQVLVRMRELNYTAKDLCTMANISKSTITEWFGKNAEPKLYVMQKVVKALGGKLVISWD